MDGGCAVEPALRRRLGSRDPTRPQQTKYTYQFCTCPLPEQVVVGVGPLGRGDCRMLGCPTGWDVPATCPIGARAPTKPSMWTYWYHPAGGR